MLAATHECGHASGGLSAFEHQVSQRISADGTGRCRAGYGAPQAYPMQNGGMNPFGSPSPTGSYASYASSPQPTYQSQSPSLNPSPGARSASGKDPTLMHMNVGFSFTRYRGAGRFGIRTPQMFWRMYGEEIRCQARRPAKPSTLVRLTRRRVFQYITFQPLTSTFTWCARCSVRQQHSAVAIIQERGGASRSVRGAAAYLVGPCHADQPAAEGALARAAEVQPRCVRPSCPIIL